MTVAIIDYGSGNLRSVAKAFEHVAGAGQTVSVIRDPKMLSTASHIVLPGVGAFADCMQGLKALPGMLDALKEQVMQRGKNFLGICVGLQMLFERGHEHGTHAGLGWLKGEVVALAPNDKSLKIPHMGWNNLTVTGTHPFAKALTTGDHAYFVHSYHAQCADASDVAATVDYGGPVVAAVARGNIMGTQFHPEKSQQTGLTLLTHFMGM